MTTVVNRAEILAGLAQIPDGQRKRHLTTVAQSALGQLGVCLPLALDCAAEYAAIVAMRTRAGRPIGSMDALIAAIARSNSAVIATRNTGDFTGLGISIIDPWSVDP